MRQQGSWKKFYDSLCLSLSNKKYAKHLVNDNFEKMHITFFVYDEGNLDHEILYTHGDQVDWTINEWKNAF